MGLKAPESTDVYRATTNSVALQRIGVYHLTRARKAQTRETCSATANDVAPFRPLPPLAVTVLKHCRCVDCRHWLREPYSMCKHGIICNGVKETPQFPPDAWHYCVLYYGPQISRDVWVWPKVAPQAANVGARSQDPREGDHNARMPTVADTGERGAIR